MNVLYSTGCPRCQVLKKKLEQKGIQYEECSSVEEMERLGIERVPVLKVGDMFMEFVDAFNWVNRQECVK